MDERCDSDVNKQRRQYCVHGKVIPGGNHGVFKPEAGGWCPWYSVAASRQAAEKFALTPSSRRGVLLSPHPLAPESNQHLSRQWPPDLQRLARDDGEALPTWMRHVVQTR